eukprot:944689-Pelagomonas_calceolata.AAC.1
MQTNILRSIRYTSDPPIHSPYLLLDLVGVTGAPLAAAAVTPAAVALAAAVCFGVPSDHNVRAPAGFPRRMLLDLSQHVIRNAGRSSLRAHTLRWRQRLGILGTLFCVMAVFVMRFKMKLMPFWYAGMQMFVL